MQQNIEDTFHAETATEFALMNRIQELRIMLYERGNFMVQSNIPRDIDLTTKDAPLTLRLAASVTSEMEQTNLRITARTYGPDEATFGLHHYVTGEILAQRDPTTAIRYLDMMHRDVSNKLARVLGKPRP